tara:strand:+ start:207 stop:368 length:162 start_codon:yes stop_codon:yes gene_type:complete
MTEASGRPVGVTTEHDLLAEMVIQQLEAMLAAGNYDAVKLCCNRCSLSTSLKP